MLMNHSQDSELGQLLAHSWWEQPDACSGQGPARRIETELAGGPEPCHSQPPVSSTGPDTVRGRTALTKEKWWHKQGRGWGLQEQKVVPSSE